MFKIVKFIRWCGIVSTQGCAAIDNGSVGSGQDKAGRHVHAHSSWNTHISNCLSASLNSTHCPHICARCTPVITGEGVGGGLLIAIVTDRSG